MRKKIIFALIIFLIAALLGLSFIKKQKNTASQTENKQAATDKTKANELDFLIAGFPIQEIPLYQLLKISSSKVFVNTDPKNSSLFDDQNFAYYNVVFDSSASQADLLAYYQKIFTEQLTELSSQERVVGKIGPYRVTVSHYGDKTAYLQAYLADYQDARLAQYFATFPNVFEFNQTLLSEGERSYGLLNQKGGEIEYTKYFSVHDSGDQNNDGQDDLDEMALLIKEAQEQNAQKTNYTFDEKTATMQWLEQDFATTLVFEKNHQRLYLMLRKSK